MRKTTKALSTRCATSSLPSKVVNALDRILGRPPAALLFDLDGTLVDSAPDLAAALDATLVYGGYAAAGLDAARGWVGNGARKLVQRALAHGRGCDESRLSDTEIDALLPYFFQEYESGCTRQTVLYPGVPEALESWHASGIRMACVTNKPERFARTIIRHFGLDALMPVVLGGDSLATRKPAPEPLWEACRQLSVAVDDTIMVGDSTNDVLAARAAGMPVIAVPYGYNYGGDIADAKPDAIAERFDLLL